MSINSRKSLTNICFFSLTALLLSACTAASPSPTPQNSAMDHTLGHSTHMTVTNDQDFLQQMIPHHQEAVDTSKYLLERTENPELKAFLTQIIDTQSREITEMKTWYIAFFGKEYADDGNYMPMMGDLTKVSGTELEKLYLEGMISHHKGAVQMANAVLPISQKPEIKDLAKKIQLTQAAEIKQMEEWLAKL